MLKSWKKEVFFCFKQLLVIKIANKRIFFFTFLTFLACLSNYLRCKVENITFEAFGKDLRKKLKNLILENASFVSRWKYNSDMKNEEFLNPFINTF